MTSAPYRRSDLSASPLMFYYELTQACDLVCRHCRASAQSCPHPHELSTEQSKELIDQIASFPRQPNLVLTGGDPLKRADLFDIIRHAVDRGLHVALTPSATPLATRDALLSAKEAGVRCLGISLDGVDAATHDSFRGWQGSFERTLRMIANARQIRLPVQINTTITRRNYDQIDDMATLLSAQGIAMWSVFFLVPVGRGVQEQRISPEQYESAFEKLWIHAGKQRFAIKTTEAPHYRRFILQRSGRQGGKSPQSASIAATKDEEGGLFGRLRSGRPGASLGIRDGNGIMFVGHTGEIFPAGFLPVSCGRFPRDSVVQVYQDHPLFVSLRDSNQFRGDCGVCEYRHICGGSRSRAFALTGDPLAADPDCAYRPHATEQPPVAR